MVKFESDYFHVGVATDIVLLTIRHKKLNLLLVKRKDDGQWALPGGFIMEGESLETCARRELLEETGVEVPHLEQFNTYSEPQRDPRGQIISNAFIAIHPSGKLRLRADTDVSDVNWYEIDNIPELAFDHNQICTDAINYAKNLIETKPTLALAFHKGDFTFTELRETFEVLGGEKYAEQNKRNFHQWLMKYGNGEGLIVETGETRKGNHRPAMLFRPNDALLEKM